MTKKKKASEILQFDARTEALGRLASKIASRLQGKHLAYYAPYLDIPVVVEVTHVDQLKITGKKAEQKIYRRYTGYPGGQEKIKIKKYITTKPRVILFKAVYNMLPKNRLRSKRMKRLIFK